jgi:folate-binding protein YgfZ
MAAGLSAKVLQHLERHLISENAELADRTQELSLLRLVGPQAADVAQAAAIAPARRHRLLAVDGFDFLCSSAESQSIQQRLVQAGAIVSNAAAYETLRIEAGLPAYGVDIDEHRFVVEVNRAEQAISYTKGCYLGQEPIVMARDRGQVNRLFMGLKIEDNEPPAPGTKVMREEKELGEVTSSTISPRLGQAIALAYMRRGAWDAGTQVIVGGRNAIVSALPFDRA